MKTVFFITDSGSLDSKNVVDDYQLKAGELTTAPDVTLGPPYKIINGQWSGEQTITQAPQANALKIQVAALAYQQMITQKTITDLQTQNAQMAYQLMTAQGGATV